MPKSGWRRAFLQWVVAPGLAVAVGGFAAQAGETIVVLLDQAKISKLPERTQTVIVGNPGIADVTVQKNGVLVVTAKNYGVTNLIALDAMGAVLSESTIRVQGPSDTVVTVMRGAERSSYSCAPDCEPSLNLGDTSTHFTQVTTQAGARNALAGGK
jgi:Flp pilus assembly secretin CpaC